MIRHDLEPLDLRLCVGQKRDRLPVCVDCTNGPEKDAASQ